NNNGLPNLNQNAANQVASQGISALGLGRASDAFGYGGLVLGAASDSVSLLMRTLQDANRAQILARPMLMTADNTIGTLLVGQTVRFVSGITVNANTTQQNVDVVDLGLNFSVTPRVGRDGLIYMLLSAERSDLNETDSGTAVGTDQNGNAIIVPRIDRTLATSELYAYEGQTVVFSGLIQKTRQHRSRRVPYISDVPLLGNLFKFDREVESRSELLILITPTIISSTQDLDYVKSVESSRMSYCLGDVIEMNGDVGLSGGYGLWGPATGQVIYPDLQPTIDHIEHPEVLGNGALPPDALPSGYAGSPDQQPQYQPGIYAPVRDRTRPPYGRVPENGVRGEMMQGVPGSVISDTPVDMSGGVPAASMDSSVLIMPDGFVPPAQAEMVIGSPDAGAIPVGQTPGDGNSPPVVAPYNMTVPQPPVTAPATNGPVMGAEPIAVPPRLVPNQVPAAPVGAVVSPMSYQRPVSRRLPRP
ncbi:MAG: hypothetical protein AAFP90_12620, partial [Planctomycetota bacterium]